MAFFYRIISWLSKINQVTKMESLFLSWKNAAKNQSWVQNSAEMGSSCAGVGVKLVSSWVIVFGKQGLTHCSIRR